MTASASTGDRRLIVTEEPLEAATAVILDRAPRTWALAGGSTPRALYRRLASAPLPWGDIELFFGDERCVPPEHPDSNYRMVRETLLDAVQARAHRMPGDRCDATAYEAILRARLGPLPRLDLALLGLGEDGHTASLFPGDPALQERERWVVRVERPDHPRLTLTLPVLRAARTALFLVTGERKREALARLLRGDPIPAAAIVGPEVIIVADPAAAVPAAPVPAS